MQTLTFFRKVYAKMSLDENDDAAATINNYSIQQDIISLQRFQHSHLILKETN